MTREEAINVLKNTAWLGTDKKVGDVEKAIMMAVGAMEKQIPQKLGSKVLDYLGRARPECGNCGEVIEDAMWDYCPWCGQRIGGE